MRSTGNGHPVGPMSLWTVIERMWSPQSSGHGHFSGMTACFSALYTAGRYKTC